MPDQEVDKLLITRHGLQQHPSGSSWGWYQRTTEVTSSWTLTDPLQAFVISRMNEFKKSASPKHYPPLKNRAKQTVTKLNEARAICIIV